MFLPGKVFVSPGLMEEREMLTFSFIVHYTLMIQGVQESFGQSL